MKIEFFKRGRRTSELKTIDSFASIEKLTYLSLIDMNLLKGGDTGTTTTTTATTTTTTSHNDDGDEDSSM